MAQPANDGTMFTNGMARNRHNRRLAAQGANQPSAPSDPSSGPEPITDNPQAMKCIDDLKQMGYSAEDVEQAMQSEGQEATEAAPMQLPGVPR